MKSKSKTKKLPKIQYILKMKTTQRQNVGDYNGKELGYATQTEKFSANTCSLGGTDGLHKERNCFWKRDLESLFGWKKSTVVWNQD